MANEENTFEKAFWASLAILRIIFMFFAFYCLWDAFTVATGCYPGRLHTYCPDTPMTYYSLIEGFRHTLTSAEMRGILLQCVCSLIFYFALSRVIFARSVDDYNSKAPQEKNISRHLAETKRQPSVYFDPDLPPFTTKMSEQDLQMAKRPTLHRATAKALAVSFAAICFTVFEAYTDSGQSPSYAVVNLDHLFTMLIYFFGAVVVLSLVLKIYMLSHKNKESVR